MSFVRAILRPGEPAIRAKELALRRFWQQESNVPTYVRRKYDSVFLGLVLTFWGVGLGASAVSIKDMLTGNKK
ncbi:hypothetical protein HDV05_008026 [Chytridiales sp. JEL 0842]|nr:hypothetical protein HDV05_008026 [Chytridiales sp. JEL 0842]